jgi:hypothetical protein
MYRDCRMVIRLRADEKEAIARLAEIVRLPPSTLARKLLLDEADRRGVLHGDGNAEVQRREGVWGHD